jgi:hypothetical protein
MVLDGAMIPPKGANLMAAVDTYIPREVVLHLVLMLGSSAIEFFATCEDSSCILCSLVPDNLNCTIGLSFYSCGFPNV